MLEASDPVVRLQSSAGFGVLWLLIVLVALAALALGFYLHHRKTQAVGGWAQQRGWRYVGRQDGWARRDLGWPSQTGRAHQAKYVVEGQHAGRHAVVFEHHYTTGSGDDRKHHRATVVSMALPRVMSHRLAVARESFLTRAAGRLGMRDIELESDEFNRSFRVSGDRRFAYDVLHPRFMQWLLSSDAPGFTITEDRITVARSGSLDLARATADLDYLAALIDQIPPRLLT